MKIILDAQDIQRLPVTVNPEILGGRPVFSGTRVPVDASHGDYAGWECPNRYGRRIEWPLVQPRHHPVIIAVLLVAAAWFATRKARVRGE